jgi:hypothetical protein
MDRGRDPDAASSLAGAWKGIDDVRALELYRRALDLDPGDPYALGNVLEYEVVGTGDLAAAASMRSSIEEAVRRCRDQIDRAENLPWAAFDLAKFSLLVGEVDASFAAACLAVGRSTAPFMVRTSLRSLQGMAPLGDRLPGLESSIKLLQVGLAGVFADPEALQWTRSLATSEAMPFKTPVIIVAGGSSSEAEEHIRRFGSALAAAVHGLAGTLISGATTQGVSAIAGDLAEGSGGGLQAVGYLPEAVPPGVDIETDEDRYLELRRTVGDAFSVAEPLRYWADMIAQGIAPADVRLIAIGGGSISAAEFRMALALGAEVGVLRGSGGAAAELLTDPWWAASDRLVELPPDSDAVAGFLA